jgi:CubicO group peptidase (beta-lactamase class C family)
MKRVVATAQHQFVGLGSPPFWSKRYTSASRSASRVVLTLWLAVCLVCVGPQPAAGALDATLIERIDAFVESERLASGIPGIALAIVHDGGAAYVRGFGQDGRGTAISGDTPFPLGSLTKSFTALLVRQAIDAGQLDADAPVQRYLPWFRVADADASARITLRHLLNQTSGFSRADGIAPLMQGSMESIEELTRGLAAVSLNRPVGEYFEYSNLNYIVLGAVLQNVSGRTWHDLVGERVLQPLAMRHSFTEQDAARQSGMTALHRVWFGLPVQEYLQMLPSVAPTGGLFASAADMARYLDMLLAGGAAPSGRVISTEGVAALLAPASPPAPAFGRLRFPLWRRLVHRPLRRRGRRPLASGQLDFVRFLDGAVSRHAASRCCADQR